MNKKELAATLKAAGYTQEQVAEKIGAGVATVYRWWPDLGRVCEGAFLLPCRVDGINNELLKWLWYNDFIEKGEQYSDEYFKVVCKEHLPSMLRVVGDWCDHGLLLVDTLAYVEDYSQPHLLDQGWIYMPSRSMDKMLEENGAD